MFWLLPRTIYCQIYHFCVSDPTVRVVQMFPTIRCFVAFIFSQFCDRLRLFEVRVMQQIQGLRVRWSCEHFGGFCMLWAALWLGWWKQGGGDGRAWGREMYAAGFHKFSKNLGATFKFLALESWYKDLSISCHGVLAPRICSPLVYEMLIRRSEV